MPLVVAPAALAAPAGPAALGSAVSLAALETSCGGGAPCLASVARARTAGEAGRILSVLSGLGGVELGRLRGALGALPEARLSPRARLVRDDLLALPVDGRPEVLARHLAALAELRATLRGGAPATPGPYVPSPVSLDATRAVRLVLDPTPTEALLRLVPRGEELPSDAELTRALATPAFRELLRATERSDDELLAGLRGALSPRPADRLLRLVDPEAFLGLGALREGRANVERLLAELAANAGNLKARIAARAASAAPLDVSLEVRIWLLPAGLRSFAGEAGVGVPLAALGGDPERLVVLAAHEVFHTIQSRFEPPPPALGAPEERELYALLGAVQREGTARHVAAIDAWEDSPSSRASDAGQLAAAYDALRRRDAAAYLRVREAGLRPEGPLARFGATMARTLERREGRPALAESLTLGPLDFVARYVAASGKASLEEVPGPERLPSDLVAAAAALARRQDPRLARVLYRARARAARGDLPGALKLLAEEDPTRASHEAAFVRAELLLAGGDAVGGEAAALRAVDLSRSAQVANQLGYRLLAAGRTTAAVELFRRYVALAPEEPNAHDSLGEGLVAAGRPKEALAAYERALALDPGFGSSARAAARLRRELGAPGTPR